MSVMQILWCCFHWQWHLIAIGLSGLTTHWLNIFVPNWFGSVPFVAVNKAWDSQTGRRGEREVEKQNRNIIYKSSWADEIVTPTGFLRLLLARDGPTARNLWHLLTSTSCGYGQQCWPCKTKKKDSFRMDRGATLWPKTPWPLFGPWPFTKNQESTLWPMAFTKSHYPFCMYWQYFFPNMGYVNSI